jgi:hypothetical protein
MRGANGQLLVEQSPRRGRQFASLVAAATKLWVAKGGEQAREAGDGKRREISIARFAGSFRLPPTLPTAGGVHPEASVFLCVFAPLW